jgi:hypothetical protein
MDIQAATAALNISAGLRATSIDLEPVATYDGYVVHWAAWVLEGGEDWDQRSVAASNIAHASREAALAEIVAMKAGGL